MKNRIIEKLVASAPCWRKITSDLIFYKSLKGGGILLEIPSSCFDDTLERVTLNLYLRVLLLELMLLQIEAQKFIIIAKEFIDGDNKWVK
ncbi:hypothetical protein L2Z40_18695 (plasmid) [Acinetobacter baumannii]|nr:hypothetical protein [Acinetobacter baumannii]UVU36980.1 hypothetical protein L2Z40_18695 [Acinetobacter baumannii]